MKRRRFLTGAAQGIAVATVGAASLSTPVIAQNVRRLNMVTAWPRDFPGMGTGRPASGRKHQPDEPRPA